MNRIVEIKTCEQCPYVNYHNGYTNAFCLKLKRDIDKYKYLFEIENDCPLPKIKTIKTKRHENL